MVFSNLYAFAAFVAIGNVVSAAPILQDQGRAFDMQRQDLRPRVGAVVPSCASEPATLVARVPGNVKTQTGYETYENFMKASDNYHQITDNEYNVAMKAATAAWTTQLQGFAKDVKDSKTLSKPDMTTAAQLSQKACPLLQATQKSAQKVLTARQDAMNQFGKKLFQEGQMKAKSYQGHMDQIAQWQKTAEKWDASYSDCIKVQTASMKKLG